MTIYGTYDILAPLSGTSSLSGEEQYKNGSQAATRLHTLRPGWKKRSTHAPLPA
jgi:hypothetical protein